MSPSLLLRLEGLLLLAVSLTAYGRLGLDPYLLVLFFFAPDLSLAGYLVGPGFGARLYTASHTYLAPSALGSVAGLAEAPSWYGPAILWIAHIGFDRALGFGLKLPGRGFYETHLSSPRPIPRNPSDQGGQTVPV